MPQRETVAFRIVWIGAVDHAAARAWIDLGLAQSAVEEQATHTHWHVRVGGVVQSPMNTFKSLSKRVRGRDHQAHHHQ